MLLRIAQGDAYGMATEYIELPRDRLVQERALAFERYVKHPRHDVLAGKYTDDTQMSIAVAEVLLDETSARLRARSKQDTSREATSARLDPPTLTRELADAFVRCFQRDPRKGYSRGFQAFLESVKDASDFRRRVRNDSDKNGAAMRSVPIGVLHDPALVKRVAEVQAKITHDTPGGVLSSQAVALMSHFALHMDEPLSALPAWLDRELPAHLAPWDGAPVIGPGVGMNTARAVLTLVSQEESLLGIARRAIAWGGDTDSVLAIAWGVASARMREDLPEFFERGLEDGPYGRTFLRELGARLATAYARGSRV
jgi:ADP-ribosylglycohydrolase